MLNNVLRERDVDAQYVTLLVLVWDRANRRFVMANAGSAPPHHLPQAARLSGRASKAFPPGCWTIGSTKRLVVDAEPGDFIVLYSDGITDQINPQGEEYGRTHLGRDAEKLCGKSCRTRWPTESWPIWTRSIPAARPMHDDQTMMVLKVR